MRYFTKGRSMRISRSVLSAVTSSALVLGVEASASTATLPSPPALAARSGFNAVVRSGPSAIGRAPLPHRKSFAAPTGCSANYPTYSFTGIAGGQDVAGGNVSAVLGGYANQACDTDDAIAGGYDNIIGSSGDGGSAAQTSFIGAGQMNDVNDVNAFIGAGTNNAVTSSAAFVGAGSKNVASGGAAFVGTGQNNLASGLQSFIGAGTGNVASNLGSVVVNGTDNTASGILAFAGDGAANTASGTLSFVGAGAQNAASGNGSFIGSGGYTDLEACANKKICSPPNRASGDDSFIGAGDQNTIVAHEAFIGSGYANSIASAAAFATIGGGYQNTVSGEYATVPGGYGNEASGELSFAAGYHAEAVNNGSFVWSDHVPGSALVKDTADDQFVVRASGGTFVYSSESLTSGVSLAHGSGTWSSLSDRNAKTDIAPLDDAAILAKVAALPVSAWRYKTETGVRHVGPMAQDFYAAFGVGEDDRHITSIDEDGVALSAIKALAAENHRLRGENAAIRARGARTDARLAAVEKLVLRLVRDGKRGPASEIK